MKSIYWPYEYEIWKMDKLKLPNTNSRNWPMKYRCMANLAYNTFPGLCVNLNMNMNSQSIATIAR